MSNDSNPSGPPFETADLVELEGMANGLQALGYIDAAWAFRGLVDAIAGFSPATREGREGHDAYMRSYEAYKATEAATVPEEETTFHELVRRADITVDDWIEPLIDAVIDPRDEGRIRSEISRLFNIHASWQPPIRQIILSEVSDAPARKP